MPGASVPVPGWDDGFLPADQQQNSVAEGFLGTSPVVTLGRALAPLEGVTSAKADSVLLRGFTRHLRAGLCNVDAVVSAERPVIQIIRECRKGRIRQQSIQSHSFSY